MPKILFTLEDAMWKARIKSVNQLSDLTGISKPTLYSMKNNNSAQIHLATLSRLCDHMNCSINDLMKYEKQEGGVNVTTRFY